MSDTDRPEIGTTVDAGGARYRASTQPGVQESYAAMLAAPRQRDRHVFAHCGHRVRIERSPDFGRLVSGAGSAG